MPEFPEFKSGPTIRLRLLETGEAVEVPADYPMPKTVPIAFEMNVVDEHTINICPPKHAS